MSDGRILVVDDDPLLRGAIAIALENEGYLVDLAPDGRSALNLIAAERPDLILLDVMMPKMSGTQVLKELEENAKDAKIPVLVMTALHGMAGGKTLSAHEIIEKPFDLDDLLNKIALVMYRRGAQAPV